MPDLYLRKVIHPQASDNYRVILKHEGEDIELGSIGIKSLTGLEQGWRWGIDAVVPMRDVDSEGSGLDRADCMRQFRTAWEKFASDPARFVEFVRAKQAAKRWD